MCRGVKELTKLESTYIFLRIDFFFTKEFVKESFDRSKDIYALKILKYDHIICVQK